MVNKAYWLSEEDHLSLKEVLNWYKKRTLSSRDRPFPSFDQDQSASPIFIARTPAGGIAALTIGATGTGTGSSITGDDVPSYAECKIYKIVGDENDTPRIEDIEEATQRVYNISPFDISGSSWIVVFMERYGLWVTTGSRGEGDGSLPGTGPGAGQCELASLRTSDCLEVSDGTQTIYLTYSGSTWSSEELFDYPGGSGIVIFWFADGQLHLSINGMELLNCGDGCFSGGPLTGHSINGSGTGTGGGDDNCSGDSFTVCVQCACCSITGWDGAGWYCVDMDTGTGTPQQCSPLELTANDRCDDAIIICSGPYDSEEEALAACPAEVPPPEPQDVTCGASSITVSGQLLLTISPSFLATEPVTGSATLTYSTIDDLWDGEDDFHIGAAPPCAGCGDVTIRWQVRFVCDGDFILAQMRHSCNGGSTWADWLEVGTGDSFDSPANFLIEDPGYSPGGGGACSADCCAVFISIVDA